jgi:hypothetical protein
MLSLFLFLVLAAVVLGLVGFVVKGLFYLFIIGVLVLLISFLVLGRGMRRRKVPR